VKPRVVIVGAGISGLTVAFELMERGERTPHGLDVLCLDGAERPGGNIRSDRSDGYLCEWGPNGFLDSASCTLTLVRRVGLEQHKIRADESSAVRFIFRRGRLRRVPTGPRDFLGSDILSWPGKLRLLAEPLVRKRSGVDESIFDFAARRIGREAAAVLVDAMVSGVYAGDSRRLSLEATFPKMRRMESEHGSLFRAMLAKRKQAAANGETAGGPAGPAGQLTSFRRGVQQLTDALAQALGPRLRLRTSVRSISDMGVRGFRVHLQEGAPLDVDAVVVACPAWHAGPVLADVDPRLETAISGIPSAPLAVVHLGYRVADLGAEPDGFGFLVPRGQGPRILGTLWSSTIFPGRAPEGHALLTSMIGGAHDPGAVELDDDELVRQVRADLERCMGITTPPVFVRVFRHSRGIPQYERGHPQRLAAIDQALEDHPGLWVCGNSYRGISINLCVEEAPRVAEAALGFLAQPSLAARG
jgi:oxygen-dependent protoporphyrinogen oxidase